MTFCTHCATVIPIATDVCPACATRASAAQFHAKASPTQRQSQTRPGFLRLLYIAPIALVLAVAGAFLQRETEHRLWLASTYSAALDAAAAGDLISARDGFNTIAGYRDSEERAIDIQDRISPLEAGYADGVRAIERGEYANAVALLEPVAEQAPTLRDTSARLADAKRFFADQLLREADAAETLRDWPSAEQTLRQLIALYPEQSATRGRLGVLQREHGPIVLGKDRALWLVSPDGSEQRQITDSLQVIWPAWSPDRSRIAFLAPDPEDPVGNVSLFVVGLDDSEPIHLANGVSAHAAPVWNPDGSAIAYTSFAGYDPVYESGSIGVRVVDVASGRETDLTGADFSLAFNPAWSPDGAELAFVVKYQGMEERPQHSPGDVLVAEIGQDGFENLTNGAVRHVWSVAWSPGGDTLLLFSLFGQTWYEPPSTSIRLLDRAAGTMDQIAGIDDQPTMPVWSPNGSSFAYTMDEKRVVIADTDGRRQTADAAEVLSGELTWSPDGNALILSPWSAESPSTVVELANPALKLSTVNLEFDSSPPFLSPPQWAPAVALPPEENPSVSLTRAEATPQP